MSTYVAHGMRIRSTRPLPGLSSVACDGAVPDLEISWESPRRVPERVPHGEALLACTAGGRLRYAAARTGDGSCLRFLRCCEFRIDAACTGVRAHVNPAVAPGLGGIIAAGSLLAFVLALRGHLSCTPAQPTRPPAPWRSAGCRVRGSRPSLHWRAPAACRCAPMTSCDSTSRRTLDQWRRWVPGRSGCARRPATSSVTSPGQWRHARLPMGVWPCVPRASTRRPPWRLSCSHDLVATLTV